MKSFDFLHKLQAEGKLELIESSKPVSLSYEKKSRDCLLAARLLFNGSLYENSIGEAYYSMYNILQSLFFQCGIKCENHSAAALLLKHVFYNTKIYGSFSWAKGERIDKQYYTPPLQRKPVTKASAQLLMSTAEDFILHVNAYKSKLTLEDIKIIRTRFIKL